MAEFMIYKLLDRGRYAKITKRPDNGEPWGKVYRFTLDDEDRPDTAQCESATIDWEGRFRLGYVWAKAPDGLVHGTRNLDLLSGSPWMRYYIHRLPAVATDE